MTGALPSARAFSAAAQCRSQAGRGEVDHGQVESEAKDCTHTACRRAGTAWLAGPLRCTPPSARRRPGCSTSPGSAEVLSEPEQEVAFVRDGLACHEIGDTLFISSRTVEHHVARLRSKLDAKNPADSNEHRKPRPDWLDAPRRCCARIRYRSSGTE
ncbi:helix-turn-helix transcriptional regulator [Lentzea sp. NPDC059081]|uniref:helix-turn-helix domain-containing protein n=1 Tax=Lentzea sp. NPDC059081 TaxID=3346719 RepID=UPI003683A057